MCMCCWPVKGPFLCTVWRWRGPYRGKGSGVAAALRVAKLNPHSSPMRGYSPSSQGRNVRPKVALKAEPWCPVTPEDIM